MGTAQQQAVRQRPAAPTFADLRASERVVRTVMAVLGGVIIGIGVTGILHRDSRDQTLVLWLALAYIAAQAAVLFLYRKRH